jgi:hypothetical protein
MRFKVAYTFKPRLHQHSFFVNKDYVIYSLFLSHFCLDLIITNKDTDHILYSIEYQNARYIDHSYITLIVTLIINYKTVYKLARYCLFL